MRKIVATLAASAVLAVSGCSLEPAPVQPPVEQGGGQPPAVKDAPVKLTASVTEPQLDDYVTGPFSCVALTVVNQTQGAVQSSPHHFAITGTDGTKREVVDLVDRRSLSDVQLAPGENAKGVVCAKGKFTPKTLAFDDLTNQARAQVAP